MDPEAHTQRSLCTGCLLDCSRSPMIKTRRFFSLLLFPVSYFKGHDDDIVCLAIDPSFRVVATGQMQSSHRRKERPPVHLWDASSGQKVRFTQAPCPAPRSHYVLHLTALLIFLYPNILFTAFAVLHSWKLCTLGGFHQRAVLLVAFSADGKQLVSIGQVRMAFFCERDGLLYNCVLETFCTF